MEKSYPRVLVVTCDPLSDSGSNGKVLSELFCDWESDKLAQFYVTNEMPNFPVCRRYYRLTDNEAKNAFLGKKTYGRPLTGEETEQKNASASKPSAKYIKKNPLTRLLRDLVWNSGRWQSPAFYRWVDEFSPEVIVVMVGEASFIPKIAMRLSKRKNIPIVIFNTENYCLKKHNYMKGQGYPFLSWLFRKNSKRVFRKLMKKSACEIYNSEFLQAMYKEVFPKESFVLYQPTSLTPFERKKTFEGKFSYMGSLGLGRHVPLIEIGEALQAISEEYYLDVYGRAQCCEVEKALNEAKGIRFHGPVPYCVVKERTEESDLLFHAEAMDEFHARDLCTGFTTKIADSLLSGRPFVMYAPKSIAGVHYLLENECAHVITDKESLGARLKEICENEAVRNQYLDKALAVGMANHNAGKNCEKMRTILWDVLEKTR